MVGNAVVTIVCFIYSALEFLTILEVVNVSGWRGGAWSYHIKGSEERS